MSTTARNSEIEERVRAFVIENFLYARSDATLASDAALLEGGIIDSMGVVELIAFIEEQFDVAIGDDEITEENLGTLRDIAGFVEGKRAASASD